jgi:hypothetical protein
MKLIRCTNVSLLASPCYGGEANVLMHHNTENNGNETRDKVGVLHIYSDGEGWVYHGELSLFGNKFCN